MIFEKRTRVLVGDPWNPLATDILAQLGKSPDSQLTPTGWSIVGTGDGFKYAGRVLTRGDLDFEALGRAMPDPVEPAPPAPSVPAAEPAKPVTRQTSDWIAGKPSQATVGELWNMYLHSGFHFLATDDSRERHRSTMSKFVRAHYNTPLRDLEVKDVRAFVYGASLSPNGPNVIQDEPITHRRTTIHILLRFGQQFAAISKGKLKDLMRPLKMKNKLPHKLTKVQRELFPVDPPLEPFRDDPFKPAAPVVSETPNLERKKFQDFLRSSGMSAETFAKFIKEVQP